MRKMFTLAMLLSVFHSFPSHAASPLWESGLAELKEIARNGQKEVSRFYIHFSGGQAKEQELWSTQKEGDAMRAEPDFAEVGRMIGKVIATKPSQVTGCFLHTHERSAYLAFQALSEEERNSRHLNGIEQLTEHGLLSAPPGGGDISIELGLREEFAERGSRAQVKGALGAVDSLGIWYWDVFANQEEKTRYIEALGFPAKEQALIKEASADINIVRVPFMISASRANLAGEAVSSQPDFKRLLLAYAFNDVKIRFVPFSQVAKEGPCGRVPN